MSEQMTPELKARFVAGLLDLVLPGSMLRFVYSRFEDRVFITIEGADKAGSSRLREQLKIALETLRSHGLLFNPNSGKSRPQKEDSRFVALRPKTRLLALSESVGFRGGPPQSSAVDKLAVPDLPPMWAGRWLGFAPRLLLEDDRLKSAEIEFRARRLSSDELRIVQVIYNDRVEKNSLLMGKEERLPALERFLGLWLQSERGWSVRCRVAIDSNAEVPAAKIEMLASEMLGVPCEIDSPSKRDHDAITLSESFPAGWPFPSLLPASEDFLRLSASKVVNRQLPILPKTGLVLGKIEGCELRLPLEMRDRHTYIVGATGTGKSTLLLNLIQQDLAAGRGVALLDPHGDLCDGVLDQLPKSRVDDTFFFDLSDGKYTPGFNLLELSDGPHRTLERNLVVNELFSVFEQLYDMRLCGGPMFEMYFRNALLLLMESGLTEATLTEFPLLFAHDKLRKHLTEKCNQPAVVDFWRGIAQKAGGDSSLANVAPYIVSKLNQLLHSPVVCSVVGQAKTSVNLRRLMDRRGVLLIRMPKGLLGDFDTRLLGMLIVGKIFAVALGRATLQPHRRLPFNLYIDEFQNFVTPSMARLFSEARKFGLCLTLANQNLAQLAGSAGTGLLETVLGNVGNLILFRLGVFDAEQLAPYAKPQLTAHDLQRLPNFMAFARILEPEGPVEPLVFATLPSNGHRKASARKLVLQRRKTWSRSRVSIESDIEARRERLLAQSASD